MTKFFYASLLLILALSGRLPAAEPASTLDLVYARASNQDLALDLFLPANIENPPLVLFIHGGGWHSGSRKKLPVKWLTEDGFAVASVSYRLSDKAIFPAQIHDCKAAIRWLRANASKYGYDASRVGVAGTSAGGHLAALVGTSAEVAALEGDVGGNLDQSSRVQAIADYYGPTDFILRSKSHPARANAANSGTYKLLGGPANVKIEMARQASPVTYVSKDDPPLLILHGDRDVKVFLDQSERIVELYQKHDLDVALHVIPGAGHGGPQFNAAEYRQLVRAFFAKHLRGQ